MNYTGLLISFEGGEGSGKSSQINWFLDYLIEKGYDAIVVRNPGSSQIGKKIRQILLDPESTSICLKTEVFLHAASLHQNLKTIILPALDNGKIVICDRYLDSALVYQGTVRGMGEEFINDVILHTALEHILPHISIFLDIPESLVKPRTSGNREKDESRIENEPIEFHVAIRRAYWNLASKYPERIRILDANQPFEQVSLDILNVIQPWIA